MVVVKAIRVRDEELYASYWHYSTKPNAKKKIQKNLIPTAHGMKWRPALLVTNLRAEEILGKSFHLD